MDQATFDLATLFDDVCLSHGTAVEIITRSGTSYRVSPFRPTPANRMASETHVNGLIVQRGTKHTWSEEIMVQRHVVTEKPFRFGLTKTSPVVSIVVWDDTVTQARI